MFECIKLNVPGTDIFITPGCKVKLGRFESEIWVCKHGWYSYAGNRQVCGWYMYSKDNPSKIKPISMTDLDDIYLIEN